MPGTLKNNDSSSDSDSDDSSSESESTTQFLNATAEKIEKNPQNNRTNERDKSNKELQDLKEKIKSEKAKLRSETSADAKDSVRHLQLKESTNYKHFYDAELEKNKLLETHVLVLDRENTTLREQNDRLDMVTINQQNLLRELENQNTTTQTEMSKLKKDIAAQNTERQNLSDKYTAVENELNALKENRNSEFRRLQKTELENKELKARIKHTNMYYKWYIFWFGLKYNKQTNELKTMLQDAIDEKNLVTRLKEEMRENFLNSDLNKHREQRNKTQNQKMLYEHAGLDLLDNVIKNAQNDLQIKMQRNETLEEQIAQLSTLNGDLTAKNEELQKLNGDLTAKNEELQKLNGDPTDKNCLEIDGYKQKNEELETAFKTVYLPLWNLRNVVKQIQQPACGLVNLYHMKPDKKTTTVVEEAFKLLKQNLQSNTSVHNTSYEAGLGTEDVDINKIPPLTQKAITNIVFVLAQTRYNMMHKIFTLFKTKLDPVFKFMENYARGEDYKRQLISDADKETHNVFKTQFDTKHMFLMNQQTVHQTKEMYAKTFSPWLFLNTFAHRLQTYFDISGLLDITQVATMDPNSPEAVILSVASATLHTKLNHRCLAAVLQRLMLFSPKKQLQDTDCGFLHYNERLVNKN
jgi:hypothetical protein